MSVPRAFVDTDHGRPAEGHERCMSELFLGWMRDEGELFHRVELGERVGGLILIRIRIGTRN